MKLEEVFGYVNSRADEFLDRDKSGKGFICPICGSGSGPNGTGITENPKKPGHFTCWSGDCFKNRSLSDILAIKNGIDPTETREVALNAAREVGIEIDIEEENPYSEKQIENQAENRIEKNERIEDSKNFFDQCHKNIEKTDYWKKRGLSKEIVDSFNIGFCQDWKHPKTPNAPATDRLIIPTGEGSYLARAVNPQIESKYSKQKVGPTRIFNIKALFDSQDPIFVVEGEIDAMSVIMAGGSAVGLGSLSMVGRLLDEAVEARRKNILIIALDNDSEGSGAGNKAQKKIQERKEELKKKGLQITFADTKKLFLGCKDANEALCKDSELFKKAVMEEMERAKEEEEKERERELAELKKDSALESLPLLMKKIEESKGSGCTPTGFSNLDRELDGGLFPGLYIIGAISSLGKTTFCLQMADQIAKQSQKEVLIFSLEMSREELMAKSISRLTAAESDKAGRGFSQAKSTRGILAGSRYENYSQAEKEIIGLAMDEYRTFAGRIYIHESSGETTVESIRRLSERHFSLTGSAPVIIIDYIQIIDPMKNQQGMTDKQITDRNVKALKMLSRDLDTSVIGISSFNRDNYNSSVNMASFKESGAIEYSSDVLLGLQFKEMDKIEAEGREGKSKAKSINEKAAKNARELKPIQVQLKILKNRNGSKGSVDFDFYPVFNRFQESESEEKLWVKKS